MRFRHRSTCGLVLTLAVGALASAARGGLIVPVLNSGVFGSRLYLDFDGDDTPNYANTYAPGHTDAYDIDGDPNNFSQQELDNIFTIWQGVSEKYSPFKINVTTVIPPVGSFFTTVVIGGNGTWSPSPPGGGLPGGIGIQGSYAMAGPNYPNLAFVFSKNLANGTPRYVAEAAAHEAGHGYGLGHQSLFVNGNYVQEYNPGDAQRAPIMGKSYFATRGQWWQGPTSDGSFQDDLSIINSTGSFGNNIGYRVDDHPSDPAGAADPVTVNPDFSLSAKGIITTTTDVDMFSFVAPGGPAHIVADVAPVGPMLDLSLSLYDSAGNSLANSATSSLGESLDYLLNGGQTYKIGISSAGNYGDIGQYFISGFIPEPGSAMAFLLLPIAILRRRRSLPV